MSHCYPAIILFLLSLFIMIQLGRNLWWGAGIVVGSIPFIFAIITLFLCKKGYTKLSWIAPLTALLCIGMLFANI